MVLTLQELQSNDTDKLYNNVIKVVRLSLDLRQKPAKGQKWRRNDGLWFEDGVVLGVGLGCEGKGKGDTQKHAVRWVARHTYTFTI